MKFLLFILLIYPFYSQGQRLAILDRQFIQPITRVDTITLEQASKGILPVYFNDVNAIIQTMQTLVKYVNSGKVIDAAFFELGVGNSKCIVRTQKTGSSNKFNVVLKTKTPDFKTYIVLVDNEPNKRASQRLTIFMDYLRNNLSGSGQKF